MGHITSITVFKNNQDDDIQLFEANNTLPFFWFGVFGKPELEEVKTMWFQVQKYIDEDNALELEKIDDIQPSPFVLEIELHNYKKYSQQMLHYLQQHYPENVALYQEFIRIIDTQFTHDDDYLRVDIFELYPFFDTIPAYHNTLLAECENIKNNLKFKSKFYDGAKFDATCGFANTAFTTYSPIYTAQVNEHKAKREILLKSKTKKSKWLLLQDVLLFLLCPFFTLAAYKIFQNEGLSFHFWVTAISNIICYFYFGNKLKNHFFIEKI